MTNVALREVEGTHAPSLSSQQPSTSITYCRPDQLCVVCMEREKRVVLLPCKHCCMCKECTDQIVAHGCDQAQCPVCRQLIVDTLEPFF